MNGANQARERAVAAAFDLEHGALAALTAADMLVAATPEPGFRLSLDIFGAIERLDAAETAQEAYAGLVTALWAVLHGTDSETALEALGPSRRSASMSRGTTRRGSRRGCGRALESAGAAAIRRSWPPEWPPEFRAVCGARDAHLRRCIASAFGGDRSGPYCEPGER